MSDALEWLESVRNSRRMEELHSEVLRDFLRGQRPGSSARVMADGSVELCGHRAAAGVCSDLVRLLDDRRGEYAAMTETALRLMVQVPDPRRRIVLMWRWVLGKSWGEIADKLGVTERTVFHIAAMAKKDFAEIYNRHFAVN